MKGLVARVKALLLTPRTEWPVIARERTTAAELFINYVAILAAIPAVVHLIGQAFVSEARVPFLRELLSAVLSYLVSLAAVYVIAWAIDLLAPRFGGKRNFPYALKLSAYAHTPFWLAGIFLLVPGLNFLLVLGLYGFYLLWLGLPLLMEVPDADAPRYTAWVALCALVPVVLLGIV